MIGTPVIAKPAMNRTGIVGVITTVLVLVAASLGASAQGSPAVLRNDSRLAPGVTYTEMKIAGPQRIKILTVDPAADAAVDVVTASRSLPGFDQTSDMAASAGALAAVNGDFGLYPGRPAHAYVKDGVLEQTSVLGVTGKNFATGPDKAASVIGRPNVSVKVEQSDGDVPFTVERWNQGPPRSPEIGGYSSFGGRLAKPPKGACSARLALRKTPSWEPGGSGITRAYAVEAVGCGAARMPLGDGIVLAARTDTHRASDIASLSVGERVTITWSMGWEGITDAIGGSPILVDDGKIMVSACSAYLCTRQPRTAVGITDAGQILLVTIDGRQPGFSVGMTEVQEANFMKSLGASWAMNLDGGGSSTMWVKGKGVVNSPSDGSERSVSSAVLLLPGPDPGEPNFGSMPTLSPALLAPTTGSNTEAGRAAFRASITDPGSTGGLLDAIARSDREMSPVEKNWVARFRAAQVVSPRS